MLIRIASLEAQLREREEEAAGFDAEIKRLARERDEDGIRAANAESALAAAREESERLTNALRLTQQGEASANRLYQQTAQNLAALRFRADDSGRVERVAKADYEFDHENEWGAALASTKAKFRKKARAVLVAADGKGGEA